jgi:hypothetical protein
VRASPDTRRTLAVAPLIGDKRCYGECPARLRRVCGCRRGPCGRRVAWEGVRHWSGRGPRRIGKCPLFAGGFCCFSHPAVFGLRVGSYGVIVPGRCRPGLARRMLLASSPPDRIPISHRLQQDLRATARRLSWRYVDPAQPDLRRVSHRAIGDTRYARKKPSLGACHPARGW